MACLSPLKLFYFPEEDSKNGRNSIVCSYRCDHIERSATGVWSPVYESGISPIAENWSRDYITIPCGKCVECRLAHAREWAVRCMLESKEHEHNFFLTFTYNDLNLPLCFYTDSDGVVHETGTLQKSDLQDFWKALRQKIAPAKIRYFACGEYGSPNKTLRPHYHAIVFGLELNDLKFLKRSPRGDVYYTSEFLDNIWCRGNIIVGEVTPESCSYTARYVLKKAQNADIVSLYDSLGLEPEFVVMSRRPGIAASWVDQHPDFDKYLRHYIGYERGSISFTAPRYFKKLLRKKVYESADAEAIVDYSLRNIASFQHNEEAEEIERKVIESATRLDYVDYLEQLEGIKLRQSKRLVRNGI